MSHELTRKSFNEYGIEEKQEEEELIASERAYRAIFNREFNLSFFKLKSDQCDLCNVFKAASLIEKIGLHISTKIIRFRKQLLVP